MAEKGGDLHAAERQQVVSRQAANFRQPRNGVVVGKGHKIDLSLTPEAHQLGDRHRAVGVDAVGVEVAAVPSWSARTDGAGLPDDRFSGDLVGGRGDLERVIDRL